MKVISLFSGAGGMDIGFEQAGFEVVVAVEQDPSCCHTLRKNRPNLHVLERSVTDVSGDELLYLSGLKKTEPALVIGGPPCQSFSLAGKRMGLSDDRGLMILEFSRIVHEVLPTAFVMENVKGMMNWEQGKAIEAVLNEFREPRIHGGKEYHYDVSCDVLNAVDFGVPQYRERLFLVGNRVGKTFGFPKPTHAAMDDTELLFEPSVQQHNTVWNAIGSLPPADEPSDTAKRVAKTIKGRIVKHGY